MTIALTNFAARRHPPQGISTHKRTPNLRRRTACALSVAALVSLLAPSSAWGQMPNLVDVSAQYVPSTTLDHPKPLKAQIATYTANLNVPLRLGEKTFLFPGLAYRSDAISYSDRPPGFVDLRAFHSLEVPLLFVQLLPNGWSFSLRASPGVAGDSHFFDTDLLRLSGSAVVSHTFSDRFAMGVGAMGTYMFGSLLPLPAVRIDWKPVDGLRLEAFAPAFVNLKYTFGDRVEIGARADFSGAFYGVRDDRVRNAWPCRAGADDPATPMNEAQANPKQCVDHVAYSVGAAGGILGVRIVSSLWVTAFAGHTFFRRFERQNKDNDTLEEGEQDLPNMFIFRTGLAWRIPHS
ncbi:DUF6268 family outer membrane beta-barrel protein [Pendulispora albinea]|uniref:DUF6268 family outer membrane beta-barrel protein n=1 Tax=Pendulispora albinea TaxID=2741071 RepID=A0ABZ2M1V4_9BACT